MTPALLSGPLAHAIGWTLLHLVWQGAIVAASLSLLLRLCGRSANLRYLLSCAALALIVALGVGTAFRSYPRSTSPVIAATTAPLATPVLGPGPASGTDGSTPRITAAGLAGYVRVANEALPVVVTLWALGVVLLSIRLGLDWLRARRLVDRSPTAARASWQAAARRLAAALGVRQAVRLLESAAVEVPTVIGAFRPAILLPASTLTGLTPVQLEMILAHELAHIRRHDFLVNLLQTAVETLLFYHPAVWWISRQVRIERENCCDDLAVAVCGSPLHYARALARLEELRATAPALALSANGGSLLQRVRRLVAGPTISSGPVARGLSAAAILSCLLLMFAAQSFSAIGARRAAAEKPFHRQAVQDDPAIREHATPLSKLATLKKAATDDLGEPGKEVYAWPAAGEPDASAESGSTAAPETQATSPVPETRAAAWEDGESRPADGRPSLEELIALRNQGVTSDMVREVRELFPDIELMEIASLYAVGATPDYVRVMRSLGLDITEPGEAQSMAAVGVTREYVRAMRRIGFPLTSPGEASGMRAVGVTPEYVRAMRAAGFPIETPGDAQSLCAVGVTPDYVREMRRAGVELEQNDAQSLCALGVTPEFVRRLAAAGYPHPTASQLSRLAAAGISGDFIREMSQYRTQ